MTLTSLQTLTWTTVIGAVVGALLLASSPSAEAEKRAQRPAAGNSPGTPRTAATAQPGVVRIVDTQPGSITPPIGGATSR